MSEPSSGSAVPTPILLAALAADCGVRFVTVGSAALHLAGEHLVVHDLDVVPDLDLENLTALGLLVDRYRLEGSPRWPPVGRLLAQPITSATTIYGRLDVLVERSREDGAGLRSDAAEVTVLGVPVTIASADRAWELRRRFKGETVDAAVAAP